MELVEEVETENPFQTKYNQFTYMVQLKNTEPELKTGLRVWLDDIRPEPPGWKWVKHAHEAIKLLENGCVDEISLDHDLYPAHYRGENLVGTGYDVLAWLETALRDNNFPHQVPVIHIHTQNAVGWVKMINARQRIRELVKISA